MYGWQEKSSRVVCRLDLYGAWRLLAVFETPDRCILLLVAEHTRTANPYRLLYTALGITEPSYVCAAHSAVLAFELANRAYFAASVSDRGDEFFDQFTDPCSALLAEQETRHLCLLRARR